MRVDVWSDVVCPWCYLGKRRFERALSLFEHAAEIEVVHRSFQLDPAAPADVTVPVVDMLSSKYGMSRAEAEAANTRLERLAAADGLEYHLQGGMIGNTFDAHRLIHLGKAHGAQDRVLERFYRAHFTEQRSLFAEESLVALAGEAGLDAAEARGALRQDAYAAAVDADLREARALGITGVPFFVLDGQYAVSGAQSPEVFSDVLRRAWSGVVSWERDRRTSAAPNKGL